MRFCFDIDGTICSQKDGNYLEAEPFPEVVQKINNLHEQGDYIILFTARGSTTGIDWRTFTEKQLDSWGVKYHELIFGKPEADFYIDDKGVSVEGISRYTS